MAKSESNYPVLHVIQKIILQIKALFTVTPTTAKPVHRCMGDFSPLHTYARVMRAKTAFESNARKYYAMQ